MQTVAAMSVAAVRPADGIVVILLALFGAWGVWRGAARQVLSLGLLAAAFLAAGRLAPLVEPTVRKVAGLATGEALAAAWAVALFGALVLGAVLAAFVGHHLTAGARARWSRVVGGLLGIVKGAFVLVVVGYALLGGAGRGGPPALGRPSPAAEAPPAGPLVDGVRGSISAEGLEAGGDLLLRWLTVPGWIRERMEEVERGLDADARPVHSRQARRPRGARQG